VQYKAGIGRHSRQLINRALGLVEITFTATLQQCLHQDTVERVLRHDAALEMVGSRAWFAGRTTCLPYIATYVLGSPGDWRMLAIIANGQPAAAAYCRGTDGALRAFGIAVLTVTPTGIARIVVFGDPELLTAFGLPETLAG
jgi:RNA polymerase sigma-70 factor, ECF subfamily